MSTLWDKTEAEAIASDLLQFTVWQSLGLNVGEIAGRMGITTGLARRYDQTITRLLNAARGDESEEAPEAPEAAPTPLTWIVHSANGVTAVAWPINSEAAPDAPGAAPDPTKEIHS